MLNDSGAPQRTKEFESIGITDNGKFARRVFTVNNKGSLLDGVSFDRFTGTETTTEIETYNYFLDNVLQATIVITYKDSNKDFVLDARRTF